MQDTREYDGMLIEGLMRMVAQVSPVQVMALAEEMQQYENEQEMRDLCCRVKRVATEMD